MKADLQNIRNIKYEIFDKRSSNTNLSWFLWTQKLWDTLYQIMKKDGSLL